METNKILGTGNYGNVIGISDTVAKKYFKNKGIFLRELIVSKYITGHPNIVSLIEYNLTELSISYERWECSLKFVIELGLGDDEQRLILLRQIAHGLAYMHSLNVIHGDIKPSNILVNLTQLKACLIDWSTSTVPEYYNSNFSTPLYREPNPTEPKAADVYSLGLTSLVMFAGIILVRPLSYNIAISICSRIKNEEIYKIVIGMLSFVDIRSTALQISGMSLETRVHNRTRAYSLQDGILVLQRALYFCKCDKLSSKLKELIDSPDIIQYLFNS